ncbi:hypothetical protein BDM02DRAFT_3120716 [Thelephora ganbajun]|uniref:Uncharacterized protein n=1 Tax=Thelephora ganbajun TaxID=370292 RepID=A0ACB6Z6A8_THEGA|nr:hypothetical protein BDM02DRAFT_3120716 [Thelephora ganbajun]
MSAAGGSGSSDDRRLRHESSFTSPPQTTPSNPARIPAQPVRSASSQWSPAETPQHHHQGTSYFSYNTNPNAGQPVSPTPRRTLRTHRSMSATSTRHRGLSISSNATARGVAHDDPSGVLSEEEEDDHDGGDSEMGGRSKRPWDHVSADRDRDPRDSQELGDDNDREAILSARSYDEDLITLKERQSLINVEHPFGLPIWKPALYKKSRTVTRNAEEALHSIPSAQAEKHLLPGNIFWTVLFGWWLSLAFLVVSAVLYLIPGGGRNYATLVYGLGWYIFWPFGKYLEGDLSPNPSTDDEELANGTQEENSIGGSDGEETATPRGHETESNHSTITQRSATYQQRVSVSEPNEGTSLLSRRAIVDVGNQRSYGAVPTYSTTGLGKQTQRWLLGKLIFWLFLLSIIIPLLFIVCIVCYALVFTIPMARLNWALIKHLVQHPTSVRFCSAPAVIGVSAPVETEGNASEGASAFTIKSTRLSAGQLAPSGSPTSTVLLCIYKATGWQYYKYTIGGVNILFINLIPAVFLVILDGMILLPWVEHRGAAGKHVPAFIVFLASRALIFILCLASVIPLSYFIGMAVASISAQSSIGMGAVINATFGSIIEVLLYCIALKEGKGRLVEGSIVGSLLAGVLLMPGMSMCGGAVRRKEQKFNAKSAGVTSMMLMMAFIGTLTPTLFYQTYGTFQLVCTGCPPHTPRRRSWECQQCYYALPEPVYDQFYQSTVKSLVSFCAAVLLFSYLIGLWFSLRTHASQIWQNPQQLLHPELPGPGNNRISVYQKLVPAVLRHSESVGQKIGKTPIPTLGQPNAAHVPQPESIMQSTPAPSDRRISYAQPPSVNSPPLLTPGIAPLLETVNHAIQHTGLQPTALPENMTREDFTRAVAVATVSALRHQEAQTAPGRYRTSGGLEVEDGAAGGHDAPSWSRLVSASVLLGCTALYAVIAELLVGVVDVVLERSGIDEKFLGVTLFALVPNTTEFMNAISFALNGNIALSMEIGSAYALQVCLLQIPAMVAFSAWYAPEKMGSIADTFSLILPRWDVISIILSVFLMTYTYIEAKSNYHRGSILILSYLVLTAGFYWAPSNEAEDTLDLQSLKATFQYLGQFFITS